MLKRRSAAVAFHADAGHLTKMSHGARFYKAIMKEPMQGTVAGCRGENAIRVRSGSRICVAGKRRIFVRMIIAPHRHGGF